MYILVNSKQVKSYENECLKILHLAQAKLRKEQKITFEIRMVGSGAKRIVTQNGKNGALDLDFNLVLRKIPKKFSKNLLLLKRTIRQVIDQVIPKDYSNGKDSTSVITYVKTSDTGASFHFDIGILRVNNQNKLERLVYKNQTKSTLVWNQIFYSNDLNRKAKVIRRRNAFNQVKKRYVYLKNKALKQQIEASSYSLYFQAVNDVYQGL